MVSDPSPRWTHVESWTEAAPQRWRDLLERLDSAVICVDFDGTLAPIVEDPEQAHAHPDARDVLRRLAPRVRAVAVVTGRPVEQVLRLGDLESVASDVGDATLLVRGQYGAERWSSHEREISVPEPPQELDRLRERLPGLLADAGLEGAHVEDKGLAVAVHARRMPDREQATARLRDLLEPVAEELGLRFEPGRAVVELRALTSDKGQAVEELAADLGARALLFAGDDLGDVAAFEAVRRFRDAGGVGLLVCSASEEETELAGRADLVVSGPAGVMALLAALAAGDPGPWA